MPRAKSKTGWAEGWWSAPLALQRNDATHETIRNLIALAGLKPKTTESSALCAAVAAALEDYRGASETLDRAPRPANQTVALDQIDGPQTDSPLDLLTSALDGLDTRTRRALEEAVRAKPSSAGEKRLRLEQAERDLQTTLLKTEAAKRGTVVRVARRQAASKALPRLDLGVLR